MPEDSLRMSKKDLMEWVESLDNGTNTLALLQEFEKRFERLLMLDQTMLDTSKVLLFIKSVDALDRKKGRSPTGGR